MKRGRKQDDSLPPSRSREIQRAFRQRRSDYIRGLEQRVQQLESEIDEVLARFGEPLRYTAADEVAVRASSRKRPKNKSKQVSAPFLDTNHFIRPDAPTSSARLSPLTDTAVSINPDPQTGSSRDSRSDLPSATEYLLREANYDLASTQSSPPHYSQDHFALDGKADGCNEFDSHDRLQSPLALRRDVKTNFLPWAANRNALDGRSSSRSPHPDNCSRQSTTMSPAELRHPNSQLGLFLGINSVGSSSDPSAQLLSSFDSQHSMRMQSHACSLPSLVPDSSPQLGPLPRIGFNTFHANSHLHSTPYTFRHNDSQICDRFESCSYSFIASSGDSSPNISAYHQESPVNIFHQRAPITNEPPNGSLSTLVAIAATRLDNFQTQKMNYAYPPSPLQPSPSLVESSFSHPSFKRSNVSSDGPTSSVGLNESNSTATPCSSTPSEPKEFDHPSQYDIHNANATRAEPLGNFTADEHSTCISFYNEENGSKEWTDEAVLDFTKDMYRAAEYAELDR